MLTPHGRTVQANRTILTQADFFEVDGVSRVVGLTCAQVSLRLFFDNALQPWVLSAGEGVSDVQVGSGAVYFNEIPGSPGFYSVRFRPNAVGYWRLLLTYTTQTTAQDFDVVLASYPPLGGLNASFITAV